MGPESITYFPFFLLLYLDGSVKCLTYCTCFSLFFPAVLFMKLYREQGKQLVSLKILNIHRCLCCINLYNVSVQEVKEWPCGTNSWISNPQPYSSSCSWAPSPLCHLMSICNMQYSFHKRSDGLYRKEHRIWKEKANCLVLPMCLSFMNLINYVSTDLSTTFLTNEKYLKYTPHLGRAPKH